MFIENLILSTILNIKSPENPVLLVEDKPTETKPYRGSGRSIDKTVCEDHEVLFCILIDGVEYCSCKTLYTA